MKSYWNLILSALTTLFLSSNSWAAAGITFDGTLTESDGDPLASSNVKFRYQIRTPGTEDCLLYEEIQTHDLSATNGHFALSIGDGSGTRQDLNSWTLFDALSNRQSFSFSASDCTGVNTYTPNPTDNRKAKVFVDYGSGWEAFPAYTLNYTPMSIESYAVGGFPASSLFRVEDAGTLGNVAALTTTQYNNLVSLADGSSSAYEKSGSLNGSTLPPIGSGESVRWNGTSWESYSPLESGDETDPTVQAFAKTSLPTCTAGEVLYSDGSSLSCVTDTSGGSLSESDIPKLTSAGNGVDGGAISGIIGGSTVINTSGDITTTGDLSVTGSATTGSFSTRQFDLYDSDNSNKISFLTPATGDLTSDYTLTFPATAGTSGQVLSTDGSGTLSWISPSTGSVTSVTGTAPIVVDNSNPATPIVTLSDSGVGAATYGSATQVPVITVDAKGRVTSATLSPINTSPVNTTLYEGKVWLGNASSIAQETYVNASHLKKSDGTSQFPATCNSSQTLTWTSLTDAFTCANISVAASNVSNTAAGNIMATDVQAAINELDLEKVSKAGDTMTGMLSLPADGLNVGGSQLAVNGGNVGIGTTAPLAALEVSATATSYGQLVIKDPANYSSDSSLKNFIQGNDNSDNPVWRLGVVNNAQNLVELAAWDSFHNVALSTNGVPRLLVGPQGNVGIGTTAPQARLQVMGAIVSGYIENSGSTIEWAAGNVQTVNTCTSFTFNSLLNGGIYKLVINDSSTLTACTFADNGSRVFKFPGGAVGLNGISGATTGTQPTLVTFTVVNGTILVEATFYNP